jgi:signal peptidase I
MSKHKIGKAADKARAERRHKRQFRAQLIGFAKDIIVAMLIVVIVMASLYAISGGIWPPMVVVESESMMHGTDSHVGTIDTGDLTLVKKISSRSDIVTYVEGRPSYNVSYEEAGAAAKAETFKGAHAGFSTYSDYGEVIIYNKNGRTDETPVIHRAIVWFVPNITAECLNKGAMGYKADFPDIKNAAHPRGLMCISSLTIHKVGYTNRDLAINATNVAEHAAMVAMDKKPFAGFLTHGDHNGFDRPVMLTDQESLSDTHTGRSLAPNKVDWIVGKAVGELPWFGALKLVASKPKTTDKIPPSSWKGLITTIVLIFVIPFIVDIVVAQYQKSKAKKNKKIGNKEENDQEEEEEEVEEDKAPKTDKDDEESIKDVDLDDELSDEFKDMAATKPKMPKKKKAHF